VAEDKPNVLELAALHGVLNKVRELNLPLMAVNRVKSVTEDP